MTSMLPMASNQPVFQVGETVRYSGRETPIMTVRSVVEAETLPALVQEVRYVVEWKAGDKVCVGNVCEVSLVGAG